MSDASRKFISTPSGIVTLYPDLTYASDAALYVNKLYCPPLYTNYPSINQ